MRSFQMIQMLNPIDLSNVRGTQRSIDASVNSEMRTPRVKLSGTKNKTYWFVNWGIEST